MSVELLAKTALVYGLVIWVGGLIHLTFAAIPEARILDDRMLRLRIMAGMMRRYNPITWTAIAASAISATYLAFVENIGLPEAAALTTLYTAISLDFFHSFIYGPRASKGDAKARSTAMNIARAEIPLVLTLPPLFTLLM
ncbi:MAG: hypothetical protein QXX49_05770 [Candidatus Caldarchaeum sp.]|uniref:DUF4149 domain-containing protein n=1 Tax=Caldiarchaeum subterraneum TaxID=311458 RepID=A0A7J3VRE5_CALS0